MDRPNCGGNEQIFMTKNLKHIIGGTERKDGQKRIRDDVSHCTIEIYNIINKRFDTKMRKNIP